jgi:Ras-related protein Rab-21
MKKSANDFLQAEQPDFNYKVILVGDMRVGKTSITNRAVFDEFNNEEDVTRVVQISQKTINVDGTDKWAKIHIWDTLGQEQFMALAPLFFRRAVGAFLVFDLTN